MANSFDVDVDFGDWDRAVVALQARFERATYAATNEGMFLVERLVKRYLRTYTHPEGTPTTSPPGGPPALVTGNLRRSWRTVPAHAGRRLHTIEAHGGPTAKYGRIQELGGLTGRGGRTRLPRRPSVKPMLLVSRREIHRIYVRRWTGAIRAL